MTTTVKFNTALIIEVVQINCQWRKKKSHLIKLVQHVSPAILHWIHMGQWIISCFNCTYRPPLQLLTWVNLDQYDVIGVKLTWIHTCSSSMEGGGSNAVSVVAILMVWLDFLSFELLCVLFSLLISFVKLTNCSRKHGKIHPRSDVLACNDDGAVEIFVIASPSKTSFSAAGVL